VGSNPHEQWGRLMFDNFIFARNINRDLLLINRDCVIDLTLQKEKNQRPEHKWIVDQICISYGTSNQEGEPAVAWSDDPLLILEWNKQVHAATMRGAGR